MTGLLDYGLSADRPSPIVALSIFKRQNILSESSSHNSKILAVVRDPVTNDTHPNVISVPTQRVPRFLFQEIIDAAEIDSIQDKAVFYKECNVNSSTHSGHDPVVYTVKSILAGKLGVAADLEAGNLEFEATLKVGAVGKSCYPDVSPDRLREEYITMLNIMVAISGNEDNFPKQTPAYSHVFWVDVDRFLQSAIERNPTLLGVGLDPFKYCVHGLCISTTCSLLHFNTHPNTLWY